MCLFAFGKENLVHRKIKYTGTSTMSGGDEAPIVHGTLSISQLFVGQINGADYATAGGATNVPENTDSTAAAAAASASIGQYLDVTTPTFVGGDFGSDATPEIRRLHAGEFFDPFHYQSRSLVDSQLMDIGKKRILAVDSVSDTSAPRVMPANQTTIEKMNYSTSGDDNEVVTYSKGALSDILNHLNQATATHEVEIPDNQAYFYTNDNSSIINTYATNGIDTWLPWLTEPTDGNDNPNMTVNDFKLGGFTGRFDSPGAIFCEFTPSETTSEYGTFIYYAKSKPANSTVQRWFGLQSAIEFSHKDGELIFTLKHFSDDNTTTRLVVKKRTGILIAGYTYEAFVSWPDVTDRSLWPSPSDISPSAGLGQELNMANQPTGDRFTIGWRVAKLPDQSVTDQSAWHVGSGVFGPDSQSGSATGSSAPVRVGGLPVVQSTDPMATFVHEDTLPALFEYDGSSKATNHFTGYQEVAGDHLTVFNIDITNANDPKSAKANKGPLLIKFYNTHVTDPALFSGTATLTNTSVAKTLTSEATTSHIRYIATDELGNQTEDTSDFYREIHVDPFSTITPMIETTPDLALHTESVDGIENLLVAVSEGGYDGYGYAIEGESWQLSSTQDWSFSAQFHLPQTNIYAVDRDRKMLMFADGSYEPEYIAIDGYSSERRKDYYAGTGDLKYGENETKNFTHMIFSTKTDPHWLNWEPWEPRLSEYQLGGDRAYLELRIVSGVPNSKPLTLDFDTDEPNHTLIEVMMSYRAIAVNAFDAMLGANADQTVNPNLFDLSASGEKFGTGTSIFTRSAADQTSLSTAPWRKIQVAGNQTNYFSARQNETLSTGLGQALGPALWDEFSQTKCYAGIVGEADGGDPVGIYHNHGDVRNVRFYEGYVTPYSLNPDHYLKNVDLGTQQAVLSSTAIAYARTWTGSGPYFGQDGIYENLFATADIVTTTHNLTHPFYAFDNMEFNGEQYHISLNGLFLSRADDEDNLGNGTYLKWEVFDETLGGGGADADGDGVPDGGGGGDWRIVDAGEFGTDAGTGGDPRILMHGTGGPTDGHPMFHSSYTAGTRLRLTYQTRGASNASSPIEGHQVEITLTAG